MVRIVLTRELAQRRRERVRRGVRVQGGSVLPETELLEKRVLRQIVQERREREGGGEVVDELQSSQSREDWRRTEELDCASQRKSNQAWVVDDLRIPDEGILIGDPGIDRFQLQPRATALRREVDPEVL